MSVHIRLPKCGQGWLTNVRHIANVDWALINFIEDWFPVEARKKLRANEKEAAEESALPRRRMTLPRNLPRGCATRMRRRASDAQIEA